MKQKYKNGYSLLLIVVIISFCLLILTYIFSLGFRVNRVFIQRKYMRNKCINIAEGAIDYALSELNYSGNLPDNIKFNEGEVEVRVEEIMGEGDSYILEGIAVISENGMQYSQIVCAKLKRIEGRYRISRVYYPSLSNYTGD